MIPDFCVQYVQPRVCVCVCFEECVTRGLNGYLCGLNFQVFRKSCISSGPVSNCHLWIPGPIAMAVTEGAVGHMPILQEYHYSF